MICLRCLHFSFFPEDFAKQKYNIRWIKPGKCFCLKVKVLVLGCFIHINQTFNSKNLPTVRVFSVAFPPVASKEALKKMLKSP